MQKLPVFIFSTIFLFALFLTGCATKNGNSLKLDDGVLQVQSSPLMWQQGRSQIFYNWEEAEKYASNLTLGGYSDWRLPTTEEFLDLYFVFDFGKARPGEDTMILKGNYWSSEKDGSGFTGAWEDGDSCEISRTYKKASKGYVRAVRP